MVVGVSASCQLLLLTCALALASAQPRFGAPFPSLNISSEAQGAGIVAALGPQQTASVASYYGMQPAALDALATREGESLRLSPAGLYFSCADHGAGFEEPPAPVSSRPSRKLQQAPLGACNPTTVYTVPTLHSRSGATRKLLLDFDGETRMHGR